MEKIEKDIKDIIVSDRQRKDLGDLDSLITSIKRLGVIQPLVLDSEDRLIAGERRLRAASLAGLTRVPVCYKENLSEDDKLEMELEENVRRKDMTWQERCTSIAKIHNLRWSQAAKKADSWTLDMTGELMNISKANVSYTLQIARLILSGDAQIAECANFSDAIKLLMRRREDEIEAELARRTRLQMTKTDSKSPPTLPPPPSLTGTDQDKLGEMTNIIPLSNMLIHGDAISTLSNMPDNCVDHCITDPPYAIDMKMLQQDNTGMDISRVIEEHEVGMNLSLLSDVIPHLKRIIRPHGYLCMWCDIMNWQLLYNLLIKWDFRVQRWPIVWHKTHQCMNQAVQYNFTKNFEICIIARQEGAVLYSNPQTSIIQASKAQTLSNPFAKPQEVWDFLVRNISRPSQIILDPFCGEGSSLRSFISNWRVFLGIEINEKHYNVCLNNIKSLLDVMYRKPKYV